MADAGDVRRLAVALPGAPSHRVKLLRVEPSGDGLAFEVACLVNRPDYDPSARKPNHPRDAGVFGVEPHHLTRANDISKVGRDESAVGADHNPAVMLVTHEYVLD